MFSVLPCMQRSFFVNYKQYLTDNQGGNTLQKTQSCYSTYERTSKPQSLSFQLKTMLEEGYVNIQ